MEIYYFVSNRYEYVNIQGSITERRIPREPRFDIHGDSEREFKSQRGKREFPFGFTLKYIYLLSSTLRQKKMEIKFCLSICPCYNTSQPDPAPCWSGPCGSPVQLRPPRCAASLATSSGSNLPFSETSTSPFPFRSFSTYYLLTGRHVMFSEMLQPWRRLLYPVV